MTLMVARFQTNDKPWSDNVLPQDWEREWARRLRPFIGPFALREQGDQFGPYRKRQDVIHRAVTRMDAQTEPETFFIANRRKKGVRAHMTLAGPEAFGQVFHTVGPCKDDYPNIITRHNMSGQLITLQSPAMLAYLMAEELNGHSITITGQGFRSCELQSALYRGDPGRFADPDDSRHCRALAIDVTNTSTNLTARAKDCLEAVGFCQGVPGEPWHFAFTECG